jgi:opacity protein-like surface antigen
MTSAGSVEGLSLGKLCVLPIEVALKARFPLGEKLSVFGEAGVGYAIHSFTLDEGFAADWTAIGFEIVEAPDNGLSARLGAGLEFVISPKMSLDFTAGYNLLRSSGAWSITDVYSGETASGTLESLNFDAVTFSLGLKIAVFSPEGNR